MFQFFYSDPHFGHENIIKYCDRPFSDVIHMEKVFVNNYNQIVTDRDWCLWLGDAFFNPVEEAHAVLAMMNGHKAIVRGNHDRTATQLLRLGFEIIIEDFVCLRLGGHMCRASHYPYGVYNKTRLHKRKGETLLHGHTHNKTKMQGNCIHVGLDAWNYYPASYENIVELIDKMKKGW